jgi:uncharacterized protein
MHKRLVLVLAIPLLAIAAVLAYAFAEARRDPVMRTTTIGLDRWPAVAAPITVALLSDVHIGNATMDAARLDRIVGQVNAMHPDLVLITGDFVAGDLPSRANAEAFAVPLSHLRAPLGTVAVLGNHDWSGDLPAIRRSLARAHVTLLDNAATVRGPLALGGVSDYSTHHDDIPATTAALNPLPGARVILEHTPDIAAVLAPDLGLVLAGHTHCGQVSFPLIGAPVVPSHLGKRYLCGRIDEPHRTVIVTAGLGTSGVPFRLNVPPDWWLLRLGPKP